MPSKYALKYSVDIVMCIDATESMRPLLDRVKEHAIHFYEDIKRKMEEKNKSVNQLRVKVIVFRDFLADGKDALSSSVFYTLPDEVSKFEVYLRGIQPFGGGDNPEDGLEAISCAIRSNWTKEDGKHRHIIVVWTDDDVHPLGFGRNQQNGRYLTFKRPPLSWEQVQENARCYPADMPKTFDELSAWWGDIDFPGMMECDSKRLVIHAPGNTFWERIYDLWDNVIFHRDNPGNGLREMEYEEILNCIAQTF